MNEYKINIKLESPTLLGNGEGLGSLIDTDVIFDDLGLPYFPGRRFKGLLRESVIEIVEMFDKSFNGLFSMKDIDKIFGQPGEEEGALLKFSNFYLEDFNKIRKWLMWCYQEYSNLISPNDILNSFCEIRQHTTIEKGVSKDKSLYTLRVLKPGIKFIGNLFFENLNKKEISLLALACVNIRHVGIRRNRGYGEINCALFNDETNLSQEVIKKLEKGEIDV